MKPIVLFRKDLDTEGEHLSCQKYLKTTEFRSDIPKGSLVIGRYSVLPFYSELARELKVNDSELINSFQEHSYIADVMSWVSDLGDLTPKTWTTWDDLPDKSFVLKGRTNSRKHKWNTHMFAKTKEDVPLVANRLYDDTFIGEQGVVVREYIRLKKLDDGLNGLPVSNEWRCFFWKTELISAGFYWASFPEVFPSENKPPEPALKIAMEAAEIISKHARFFVLDVAETDSGDWIVVEVNDGQMSGLSTINQDEFYFNIKSLFDSL